MLLIDVLRTLNLWVGDAAITQEDTRRPHPFNPKRRRGCSTAEPPPVATRLTHGLACHYQALVWEDRSVALACRCCLMLMRTGLVAASLMHTHMALAGYW